MKHVAGSEQRSWRGKSCMSEQKRKLLAALDRLDSVGVMPRRSRKSRDVNQMAAAIVEDATSDQPEPDPYEGKDPAAVELGRRGGQKGGKARAQNLSAEERSKAARKAAEARWGRSK
jgi:hypothetical protein